MIVNMINKEFCGGFIFWSAFAAFTFYTKSLSDINSMYNPFENKLVWGWLSFWVNYWIVGSLLPIPKLRGHESNVSSKNDIVLNLILNMAVTLLLFIPIASSFPVLWHREWYDLPAMLFAMFVLSEGVNYTIHRIIHHPKLYFMHKAHHSHIQAEPLGAVFVSWHEMLVENPLLVMMVYRWFDFSITEIVLFSLFYSNNSLGTHSGITKLLKPDTLVNRVMIAAFNDDFHAIHHETINFNYGQCGLLDWLFGTYLPSHKIANA